MDWLSGLFEVIGGGQKGVDDIRAREDFDRQRQGAAEDSLKMQYIFFFSLLVIAAVLVWRNK